jgi:hypothetical protein
MQQARCGVLALQPSCAKNDIVRACSAWYMQDAILIEFNQPDGTHMGGRLVLENEDGIALDEVDISFDVVYDMVEDAKRWLRSGVLRRLSLLPPAGPVPKHRLWEALPPLPTTMMSHGGVLTWTRHRQTTDVHHIMGPHAWPSFADVVVVEEADVAACASRGYACVPFPADDDGCQIERPERPAHYPAGRICGYSVQQEEVLRAALVVFVPSSAVDLVEPLLLPALVHPVVLISNEPDWGASDSGAWPQRPAAARGLAFTPFDVVNFRFGPTADDAKILRWFARGATLENRHLSPIPAPIPPPFIRALLDAPPRGSVAGGHCVPGTRNASAPQATCSGTEAQANSDSGGDSDSGGGAGWLWVPAATSRCSDAARADWLHDVGAVCWELPDLADSGEANAGAAGAVSARVEGLVAAIARSRFCLLTDVDEGDEYLVWLCLWLGAVPIVKPLARFETYSLHLPIVRPLP